MAEPVHGRRGQSALLLRDAPSERGRGRWLVVPLMAVLAVFALGGGLTTVISALRPSQPAGAGQLVDVGGHRLYVECTGSGGPAVIL